MSAEIEKQLARIADALEAYVALRGTISEKRPAARPDPEKHATAQAASYGTPLSEAGAQFLAQKRAEVTPQHFANMERVVEAFIAHTAASDVEWVTPRDVAAYRDSLVARGRKQKTANQHLTILSGFFGWAMAMELTARNPTKGLKFRLKKAAAQERKAFTDAQLAHVFRPSFFERTRNHPARRCLPLVMLYSGARPEEVAQLRVGDVREVDGVLCFDFATMEEGQRRKSEASRRLVPVHSRLLSPLEHVLEASTGAKEDAKAMLWPELSAGRNGRYAEAPSRWFNRRWLRDACGIDDEKLVLYSLRHTVATALKVRHSVEEARIAQLLGHTNASMTTGRYGKSYDVKSMRKVVELLDFPVLSS